ncbi:MAG: toxin-antitoxin system YwqK family antitoxin, partial [Bacteroidota bacterium]
LNGQPDGIWKFRIAEYIAEGSYLEGREDGQWKQYYKDGTLSFEGEYLEGEPTGAHKYYWPNGNIHEERNYRLGLPDGTWKLFDENGALTLSIGFRNGEEIKVENEELPRGEPGD